MTPRQLKGVFKNRIVYYERGGGGGGGGGGWKWLPKGPLSFHVFIENGNVRRRHQDQLQKGAGL